MSDWTSLRLGDLLRPSNERSIRSDQYPVLTSSRSGLHLQSEYFNRVVASKDNTGYKVIRKGQFTYRAMSDDGFFRFNRLSEHEAGIISPAYEVFECNTNKADPIFIDYLLNSGIVLSQIYGAAQGGTRLSLRLSTLCEFEAEVPPLPEQKKIAEILSGIDRSISINTNKINSLETLYTSLLADSLRRLPGDCLEMQLADACTEVFLGLTSKVDYVEGVGIPLIRASNIRNGLIDFDSARHISHDQHLSLTKYRKAGRGDVLVTKSGSLGECAIVHSEKEFSIYESIVCLKPKPGILSTEYLFHAMQCNAVKDQFLSGKVGSAVAHLNLNDFRRITLPLPSLSDQRIISKALDAVQSSKDHLREDTNKKILLKNALFADLLSGRKRVSV